MAVAPLQIVEPYGQLIAGVLGAITPALAGLVDAGNIGPGYLPPQFDSAMKAGSAPASVGDTLPAVRLVVTASTTAKDTPAGTRRVVAPFAVTDAATTVLTETRALDTMLTIFVLTADPGGARQRDLLSGQIAAALDMVPSMIIPLPDSADAASPIDWSPGTRLYGLTARLTPATLRMDNAYDTLGLYKADLMYTARHNRYVAQTFPAIHTVKFKQQITVLIPLGSGPAQGIT